MTRTATSSSPRRWAVVGLILFLIVDALLVAWALTADRGSAGTPRAAATPSASPTPVPTTAPEPATAPARLLSVLDEDTAWRSAVGSCPGTPPTLELTTDGGRTWRSSDLAGIADVAAVATVQATSEDVASVVAFDADGCAPVLALSYVAGNDWVTYPDRVAGNWFLDPAAPQVLHTPTGEAPAPCEAVVSLAGRSAADAAVLCADHTVYRTADGGGTWSAPAGVPGSTAIAAGAGEYLLAVGGEEGCAGVAVTRLPDDAPAPATAATCASETAPQAGQVALATGGDSAWLWAGDDIVTSEDGGTTWR